MEALVYVLLLASACTVLRHDIRKQHTHTNTTDSAVTATGHKCGHRRVRQVFSGNASTEEHTPSPLPLSSPSSLPPHSLMSSGSGGCTVPNLRGLEVLMRALWRVKGRWEASCRRRE